MSGTLTETIVNNAINSTPVTQTIPSTVTSTVTTSTSGSNTVFTSSETDTGTLATTSSTTAATVAYQAQSNGSVQLRTLSLSASDSNGVKYQTTYGANNGVVDVIPETAGTYTWNDAQESYLETDPGVPSVGTNVSIDREVNADGSYTQKNGGVLSGPGTIVDDIAVEKPDFSGTETLNAVPGGRVYTFEAPANGSITYTYFNGATGKTSTFSTVDWIPTGAKPSVETDTIAASQSLDASCTTPTSFGVVASKVQQQITTVDSVLGTLETKAVTSYDVAGVGTVCATVSDSIGVFYDYSNQEGPTRLVPSPSATVPIEQITVAETLSLQKLNLPASSSRSSEALARAGVVLPHTLVLARVEHLAHQEAQRRLAALRISGGLAK